MKIGLTGNLRRHVCEVAEQWAFTEVPTLTESGREPSRPTAARPGPGPTPSWSTPRPGQAALALRFDRVAAAADATWDPTVAATKYFVLEQMSAMLAIAQRLLGGTWYYADEPFGRWMRDLQGFIPAAGTQRPSRSTSGSGARPTAKAGPRRRR